MALPHWNDGSCSNASYKNQDSCQLNGATWTAGKLPRASARGYSLSRQDANVRTEMDGGPARTRRVYTRTPTFLALSFDMSGAQLKNFRYFWQSKIDHGSMHFTMNLYLDSETADLVKCRFITPYSAALRAPNLWGVQATIEILDDPPSTAW